MSLYTVYHRFFVLNESHSFSTFLTFCFEQVPIIIDLYLAILLIVYFRMIIRLRVIWSKVLQLFFPLINHRKEPETALGPRLEFSLFFICFYFVQFFVASTVMTFALAFVSPVFSKTKFFTFSILVIKTIIEVSLPAALIAAKST